MRAKIEGHSMYPCLLPDEIYEIAVSDYGLGDVVCFREGKNIKVHRIVSIEGNTIVTKGDCTFYLDKKIQRNDIIGKIEVSEGKSKLFLTLSKLQSKFNYDISNKVAFAFVTNPLLFYILLKRLAAGLRRSLKKSFGLSAM